MFIHVSPYYTDDKRKKKVDSEAVCLRDLALRSAVSHFDCTSESLDTLDIVF